MECDIPADRSHIVANLDDSIKNYQLVSVGFSEGHDGPSRSLPNNA